MFNFKQLVESLLLEAVNRSLPSLGGSQNAAKVAWVYDLLDIHESMFGLPTDLDKIVNNCLGQSVLKPPRPSKNSVRPCLPLQRIYDVFFTLVIKNSAKINSFNADPLKNFLTDQAVIKGAKSIIRKIQQTKQWTFLNPQVENAYNLLVDEGDLLAKSALEVYNKKSIIQTMNEAIKKRTDVLSRIMAVRSPFGTPFQNLIKDTLLNPEQYASGNKKVTNDFKNIVDDLYFKQALQVGIAAKNLYTADSGQGTINNNDYDIMLNNKNGGYTIEEIEKKDTKESLALINALKNVVEYERKKAGRGEIAGRIAGGLGALTAGIKTSN